MSKLDSFDAAVLIEKKRALKKELLQGAGPFIEKKIAILSGSTIGEIKNIMELFLLDQGIRPTFYVGTYARFYEDVVYDDGALAAFQPDFIYIHTSNKNIQNFPSLTDTPEDVEGKLQAEFARFKTLWESAKAFHCPLIQNNFELPDFRVLGNKDAADIHGHVNFINRLNGLVAGYAAENESFYINDIHYLSARYGLDHWYSPSAWYLYKYALAMDHIPYLAKSVTNIIKSVLGKNKKSVVLDLDNTLWGGIIGEVGPEGIDLGNETPRGMAYADFQKYLKELSAAGVMLNVCSKNEKETAESGFARDDSPLKRGDFICFKANWEPKSRNIAKIAEEVNILPDSLVFVDDNPAEREIVRRELPSVSVPEVTAPETYIAALDRAGYFEVTTLSADDKKRNDYYRQNIERQELEQSFGDYADYLKSLHMQGTFGPFNAENLERVTQLINKTNQFNLTTRRYTPNEVVEAAKSPNYITLYGRLADKFGDNGITSALIGHIEGNTCHIDLWVMSCRVFKRDLELAMFDELVQKCAEKNISSISGAYYPTAKNLLVRDFYATIGFTLVKESDEERLFVLQNLQKYTPQNKVITVLRNAEDKR